MHTVQETSKTPRAVVYRLANVIACCAFYDVSHATNGWTNVTNYWVQQFLSSFILFWTL